jgi:ligand-binding sensor domain-containing protein
LRNLYTSPKLRTGRYHAVCGFLATSGLLIGLATLFPSTARAIDPQRVMSQYVRERWGAEQGFPRGPVYAIAQSVDGYLWIGTQEGLVRFDGLTFRLVRDVEGLAHGESVLGLMTDGEGNLWIRLDGATLLRYRNGVFDRPRPDPLLTSGITAMARTSAGELLIAVMERGAMIYRKGKFEVTVHVVRAATGSRRGVAV